MPLFNLALDASTLPCHTSNLPQNMSHNEIDSIELHPSENEAKKPRFRHHGAMAGVLIALGLLFRIGIVILLSTTDIQGGSLGMIIGVLVASIFWIWGCFHLVLYYCLHYAWGFAGFLFILGIGIIIWAAHQKPKWDRQRSMQPKLPKEYCGDPDSLY